jgi:hypothetical protein
LRSTAWNESTARTRHGITSAGNLCINQENAPVPLTARQATNISARTQYPGLMSVYTATDTVLSLPYLLKRIFGKRGWIDSPRNQGVR